MIIYDYHILSHVFYTAKLTKMYKDPRRGISCVLWASNVFIRVQYRNWIIGWLDFLNNSSYNRLIIMHKTITQFNMILQTHGTTFSMNNYFVTVNAIYYAIKCISSIRNSNNLEIIPNLICYWSLHLENCVFNGNFSIHQQLKKSNILYQLIFCIYPKFCILLCWSY